MADSTVLEYLKARIDLANYVEEIHRDLNDLATNPRNFADVRRALDYLVETRLPEIIGSPADWYNMTVEARRANNVGAARRILEEAVQRYPEDVDLLCEQLQLQYGSETLAQAEETWQRLTALGTDKVGPHWRYWVYGASYMARHRHDQKRGLELLEAGLPQVPFADLMNILGQYRVVLVDGGDLTSPRELDDATQLYRKYIGIIEERYKRGLELGVESGYVLAVGLARLLRERATSASSDEAAGLLNEALHYLEVAERTYTHDANHPIWNIYIEKAITLMAVRRYADALQVFRSLPEHMLDGRLETMARYAANLTGQTFAGPGPTSATPDSFNGAVTGDDWPVQISLRVDRLREHLDFIERRIDRIELMFQKLLAAATGDDD